MAWTVDWRMESFLTSRVRICGPPSVPALVGRFRICADYSRKRQPSGERGAPTWRPFRGRAVQAPKV
eukprot:232979-Alexandrium_andersonii.AAC.1